MALVTLGLLKLSLLLRWGLGWALCLRMPALMPRVVRGHPSVAVLIPARNEQGTLPHLLRALEAQRFRPLEVIVIDDHSSDRTAAIATQTSPQLAVHLVQPPPLPEGWCGKTWALHNGVAASRAELLVFLDADTEPAPDFLASLLACHQELGGLVSVQPYHRTEKAYEQLSVLFNLVGLMAVPLGPRGGVAFGPALVTSAADSLAAASGRHRKATSAALSRRARSAGSLRRSGSICSTSTSARCASTSWMRRPVVPS